MIGDPLFIPLHEELRRQQDDLYNAVPEGAPWTFVLPKVLAITLVLLATVAAGIAAAMAVQVFRGYTRFELANYFFWYVVPWTIDVTQLAVLALFIQVLVPHKFVGWLVMLVVIVAQVVLGRLGYEHNLYQYAAGPDGPLSEMNGQGHFAADRMWFRAYWTAAAVILVVLTNALWRRGDAGNAGRRPAIEYYLSVVVPEALGLGAGAEATAELLYRAPAEELA